MNEPYVSLDYSNFTDTTELIFTLLSNPKFKKLWCNFAHFLGFHGAKGANDRVIGNGMLINKDDTNFFLKGKNTRDIALKIYFKDFKLNFIADSIVADSPRVKNFNPQSNSSTNYTNNSNSLINVSKKISFTKSTITSVSSSHKITNDLSVGAGLSFKFPGLNRSTSINYSFSHESTFGNQEDIKEIIDYSDQVKLEIEPNSKVSVNVLSTKSLAKSDFRALGFISFSVTFVGFLDIRRSAFKKHPLKDKFFPLSFTFGNADISALDDIKQQIARKNIPLSAQWDWNIFNSNSNKFFSQNLASIYNGFAFKFQGTFSQIDSTNVVFEIGPNTPL